MPQEEEVVPIEYVDGGETEEAWRLELQEVDGKQ